MSVWAISVVRDEADIIDAFVEHALGQVDHLLIADNLSTDGTTELLETSDRVTVLEDPDPGHNQGRKMTALAEQARESGAGWVVPMDADERWLAPERWRVADVLEQAPEQAQLAEALIFDHIATPGGFGWRRAAPLPLRKVACRAVPGLSIHEGNHSAKFPRTRFPLGVIGGLEIRHFQYRSAEQLTRKIRRGAAALRATELPEEVGGHWRHLDTLTDFELEAEFVRSHFSEDPEADGLVYDPVAR